MHAPLHLWPAWDTIATRRGTDTAVPLGRVSSPQTWYLRSSYQQSVWVSPKAAPELRIPAQGIYLGGDFGNATESVERCGGDRGTLSTRSGGFGDGDPVPLEAVAESCRTSQDCPTRACEVLECVSVSSDVRISLSARQVQDAARQGTCL